MIKNTWVNLPVKSLNDSVEFFEKLGLKFNKQFDATNMLLNDNTMVTLVEEPQFKEFAQKEVADTKTTAEAVLVLQIESKDAVNELSIKQFPWVQRKLVTLMNMVQCLEEASKIWMDTFGKYSS